LGSKQSTAALEWARHCRNGKTLAVSGLAGAWRNAIPWLQNFRGPIATGETNEAVKSVLSSWAGQAHPKPRRGCFNFRPALCRTRDSPVVSAWNNIDPEGVQNWAVICPPARPAMPL